METIPSVFAEMFVSCGNNNSVAVTSPRKKRRTQMKISKRTYALLAIGLVLILVGSILAKVFNTSMGSVDVERIRFDGGHGELSGILYMPEDASADNPKPTIIVTHGYLNSAEMQDANAIELSRRGFVVLALDQYDHGHSALSHENYSDTSFFGVWLPFWMHSMFDAATYMYQQPYVLKDANGNGMLGVTGHSMGGFSSTAALAFDAMQAAESGVLMIHTGLTEGADFSYTAFIGVDAATSAATGAGRTLGRIAAQYDEFFFNDPNEAGGTVRHKNFVATPDAQIWLEQSAPEANTWYNTSDGGKRIIYQPAETHPWNHFSKTSTGHAIEFYYDAFSECSDQLIDIDADDQIWIWKELAEFVALIGFIMFIIAAADIVLALPFFKKAKIGELAVQPSAEGGAKIASLLITIAAILLPAIFFTPLMDEGAGTPMVNVLVYAGIIAALGGLYAIFGKKIIGGGITLAVGGTGLAVVCSNAMYADNGVFTAIGINSIAYWTIACAMLSLTIMGAVYWLFKAKAGVGRCDYGVVLTPAVVFSGICTGLAVVVIAYAVLFIIDAIFLADFRIWTFAFKTFDANIIPAILTYLPTFLIFYLVNTAAIVINTNTEKLQGIKGYLLAILLNAGGPAIWLAVQYGSLFATGVAVNDGSALSGIMMVAMVPTLAIAAIISRNLYKKTGNIWAPATLNAVLMTTMTVANTMVAFK